MTISDLQWKRAERARCDAARKLFERGAQALAERIGRLPGVTVTSVSADDYGRAGLRITVLGTAYWTRPIPLTKPGGYEHIRDAISAMKRGDHRSRNWFSSYHPGRNTVEWDGISKERYGRNSYGFEMWK